MQKVAGESSYWDMVDMLFFYQSSWGSNSEFPGGNSRGPALNDSPDY